MGKNPVAVLAQVGNVDEEGDLTGPGAYLFPDRETGLFGTFRAGELLAGEYDRLLEPWVEGGLWTRGPLRRQLARAGVARFFFF